MLSNFKIWAHYEFFMASREAMDPPPPGSRINSHLLFIGKTQNGHPYLVCFVIGACIMSSMWLEVASRMDTRKTYV